MSYFWLILIAVSVLFLIGFRSFRSLKTARAYVTLHAANSWFVDNDINSESVEFQAYDGAGLARNEGALIIVGVGENSQSEFVGFALEVIRGEGVIAGEILNPHVVASPQYPAARPARAAGLTILDFLIQQAAKQRESAPASNSGE
jgi:hypothetical protein